MCYFVLSTDLLKETKMAVIENTFLKNKNIEKGTGKIGHFKVFLKFKRLNSILQLIYKCTVLEPTLN